jgi:hypothetical protein
MHAIALYFFNFLFNIIIIFKPISPICFGLPRQNSVRISRLSPILTKFPVYLNLLCLIVIIVGIILIWSKNYEALHYTDFAIHPFIRPLLSKQIYHHSIPKNPHISSSIQIKLKFLHFYR